MLTEHDHTYVRFKPKDANTQIDNTRGPRQVVPILGQSVTDTGSTTYH
jgi:hypothetical protein